jgi:hypothetical protein
MVFAILLAGHISAWPWLGLLFGVGLRSFTGFYGGYRVDPSSSQFQGPHSRRLRRDSQAEQKSFATPPAEL